MKEASPTAAGVSSALVGMWTWTRPSNGCTETYTYRRDGTFVASSGLERTDGTYSIASTPDADGFFRLTRTVAHDNRGRDCAGSEADNTGHSATVYVQFLDGGTWLRKCYERSTTRCFGPLARIGAVPAERAVTSGLEHEMGLWVSLNPDCSSRGDVAIRIITPPGHGTMTVGKGSGFPSYPEDNVRRFCNIRTTPGTVVKYRSEAGFSGRDSAIAKVLWPDGTLVSVEFRIAVWPQPLVRRSGADPPYPLEARVSGIEGKVVAWAYIDSDGNVSRVTIKESPLAAFSEAVKSAVLGWKFDPPTRERTSALLVGSFDFLFKLNP